MRAQASLVLLVVGLLLFAGCTQQGSQEKQAGKPVVKGGSRTFTQFDADWAERATPMGDDHNHTIPGQHENLSTPNFEVIGWDPLRSDWYGRPAGGYACHDTVTNGERALSITSSMHTDAGMILTDVTDPTNPQKLSELVLPWTSVLHSTLTPDLKYALLATIALESGPEDPTRPPDSHDEGPFGGRAYSRDGCTGEERLLDGPEQSLPYYAGLLLVDIQNPRVPRIIDFITQPVLGAHSVQAYIEDGQYLITASVVSTPGAAGYATLLTILETPVDARFQVLSVIYPPSRYESVESAQKQSMHDSYIQRHPITGELLLYVADVYHGMWIVNIDDVNRPEYVYQWDAKKYFGRDIISHGITLPEEAWDGRHYMFLEEECLAPSSELPTCMIIVIDITNPRDPKTISAWTTPIEFEQWITLQWSLHYATLVGRTLMVSGYHAGVWAVDVSTPEALKTLPTIGVFIPSNTPPEAVQPRSNQAWVAIPYAFWDLTPLVWGQEALDDETMITYDFNTGLYAVRFDASNPAPAPEPWPMDFKFDPMP